MSSVPRLGHRWTDFHNHRGYAALPSPAACRIVPSRRASRPLSRGGKHMFGICRSLALIAAALALGVAAALAQTNYPDRPVKIIVPIGPGGSYDLVGRQLAAVVSKRTGR